MCILNEKGVAKEQKKSEHIELWLVCSSHLVLSWNSGACGAAVESAGISFGFHLYFRWLLPQWNPTLHSERLVSY